MNIRVPQSGQAARIAKAYLKTLGIDLKHTQALELIARLHGYTDNQAMQADPRFRDAPVLRADACDEYTLVASKQSSVWVTVENISVYIKKDDEGVAVDLFPTGQEDGESLAGTWALYQDALPVCGRCGSNLDDRGYCRDTTCPHHEWPQAVSVSDMQTLATEQLEAKYGVRRRTSSED